MQTCILRLIFDENLYDEITDCLLTFPHRELEFMGFAVQAHTHSLEDISEKVSGFKQKRLLEITTNEHEAENIYHYLQQSLAQAYFEVQLYPLLKFKG